MTCNKPADTVKFLPKTNITFAETLPDMNSFPLLVASVSSYKMFVSSPLAFVENQCYDLLMSIGELVHVPKLDHSIKKVRLSGDAICRSQSNLT